MDLISLILIILGLAMFETISSIDNAVINADVLATMSKKARKWFMYWGLLFAVFIIRGLLPWIIVWMTNPELGPIGALTSTFSNDPKVLAAIATSAPILLIGGGLFLILLFFHWLFLEPKNFGLIGEKFIYDKGIWFNGFAILVIGILVVYSYKRNPFMAISVVIGSLVFFITNAFKQNAEKKEQDLIKGNLSDISKIFYLEILDATFSIDGVLGAFAFTLSVPLIILGNGLGAFVVRELTVRNVDAIKKYAYLKNGAMYSIFFLGLIMMLDSFGLEIPSFVSPIVTFIVIGFFFYKSHIDLKNVEKILELKKE